jgi:predicted transposase/invertase (TIGR01784 family)
MELFSPKEDVVFKMLFGDARHIDILTAFLQAVLPLAKEEYEEVSLMPTEFPFEHPRDKRSILDVKVRTKHGVRIDVEIQVANHPALRERILYYATRMITEQVGEGDEYEKIQPAITIVIADFVLIPENAVYHNDYRLHDSKTGSTFSRHLVVHTLELPKVREDDHTALWNWLKFLKAKSEEELEMLASKDVDVKKAATRLIELSADEKARSIREAQEKARRDHSAQMRYAIEEGLRKGIEEGLREGIEKGLREGREEGLREGIEEGLRKGIEEGREEGREEGEMRGRRATARSLLQLGVALETIMAATGFSEEETLALRDALRE